QNIQRYQAKYAIKDVVDDEAIDITHVPATWYLNGGIYAHHIIMGEKKPTAKVHNKGEVYSKKSMLLNVKELINE
ncbi:MAG: hypothetical protein GWN00_39565, partial [Aliifodinibius sp.]|nr:hypothetical protein [Fodinibius sp.]NIV16665.1 hypothetical protein [Fodinibius sp.]NIY30659.1 hypothetical protein [Fodinibius sp.]